MNAHRIELWLLSLLCCVWAASCTFDERANTAKGCSGCAPGMCYFGFCVQPITAAPGSGGAGGPIGSGGAGSVQPGGGSGQGGPAGGGGMSAGGGGNGSGGHAPSGVCPNGAAPSAESCNGADDDCDGNTDEDVALGSCSAPGAGPCGGVMRCDAGKSTCEAKPGPTPEVCNGMDDDCDGVIDNDSDVQCYPDATAGCVKHDDGSFACTGLCKAGMSVCRAGKPGACAEYVAPTDELCGAADAADENCNGMVDDGCPCTGNETQSCYSGPAGTRRAGTCHTGTQHCVHSVFGACQGEVTPVAESCSNQGADDDCNRTRDDILFAGLFCIALNAQGACASGSYGCSGNNFVCVPGTAASSETSCDGVDEDCDGQTDEDFDFANDAAHCGNCNTACAPGGLCCAGVCHDPGSDLQNCGSCNNACGSNALCCSGSCVATNTDEHCGGCGGCTAGTQACCDGACVAIDSMAHCGGCAACSADACCGGQCVLTNSDAHCGGCGGCASGSACCNGQCVPSGPGSCSACTACPADQICCGATCVPAAPDAGTLCP